MFLLEMPLKVDVPLKPINQTKYSSHDSFRYHKITNTELRWKLKTILKNHLHIINARTFSFMETRYLPAERLFVSIFKPFNYYIILYMLLKTT